MDAIEITPPLERLTPEWQQPERLSHDVFRMRAPGGWLVTTVFHSRTPDHGAMAQSTVFVPDPDGTWLCTSKEAS